MFGSRQRSAIGAQAALSIRPQRYARARLHPPA